MTKPLPARQPPTASPPDSQTAPKRRNKKRSTTNYKKKKLSTPNTMMHCKGVIFDKDTNRFTSQEDTLFDEMLDEDFGQAVTIKFEGLPEALTTKESTTRRRKLMMTTALFPLVLRWILKGQHPPLQGLTPSHLCPS